MNPASVEVFNNDKAVLVGGQNSGKIEQIEISSDNIEKELWPAPIQTNCMSLGCDEKILVVSSKIPYANFLWDLGSGKRILPEIFNEIFGGHSSLCLHTRKNILASGSLVGFASLQKLDDGKFIFF